MAHPQDGGIEIDVVATGEFGIEPDAQFKKRRDHSVYFYMPLVGLVDVGEDFEEGGFSGSVSPDDAEKFAFFDFEGNVVEGVEEFIGMQTPPCPPLGRGGKHLGENTADGGHFFVGDFERFGNVFDGDGDVGRHTIEIFLSEFLYH